MTADRDSNPGTKRVVWQIALIRRLLWWMGGVCTAVATAYVSWLIWTIAALYSPPPFEAARQAASGATSMQAAAARPDKDGLGEPTFSPPPLPPPPRPATRHASSSGPLEPILAPIRTASRNLSRWLNSIGH